MMFRICKVCNNNNICGSCITNITNEDDIYFTETDIYFKTKCPYCRTVNISTLKLDK